MGHSIFSLHYLLFVFTSPSLFVSGKFGPGKFETIGMSLGMHGVFSWGVLLTRNMNLKNNMECVRCAQG